MEVFKYCRACLASGVKMYSSDHRQRLSPSKRFETDTELSIGDIYSQLFLFNVSNKNQHFCYNCASLLNKFHEFKSRCHRVHDILFKLEIAGLLNELTSQKIIQSIDRKLNDLESNLKLCPVEILRFDPFNDAPGESAYEVKIDKKNLDISKKHIKDCLIDEENNLIITQMPNQDSSFPLKIIRYNKSLEKGEQGKESLDKYEILSEKDEIDEDWLQEDQEENDNFHLHVKDRDGNDLVNNDEDTNEFLDNDGITTSHDDENVSDVSMEDDDDNDLSNNPGASNCESEQRTVSITDHDYVDNDPRNNEQINNEINEPLKEGFSEGFFGNAITPIILSVDEAKRRMMLRKKSNRYLQALYKCDICFRGFNSREKYNSHMEKHSDLHGQYECDICHMMCATKSDRRKHRTRTHFRKLHCNFCSFSCFDANKAKAHVRQHIDTNYPCDYCSETFSLRILLSTHIKRQHPDAAQQSVCEYCGKGYATLRGLLVHKLIMHKSADKKMSGPKCETCCVRFATEEAWNQHFILSTNHGDRKCKRCGEICKSVAELRSHSMMHSGWRQPINGTGKMITIPCDGCDLSFRPGSYKTHVNLMHAENAKELLMKFEEKKKLLIKKPQKEKRAVCEVCGKTFPHPCHLKYHMRSHTGERPFKCKQCEATFRHSWQLKWHEVVHFDGGWKCDVCGKLFPTSSARQKHVNIYHTKKRHKCPKCGKAFPYMCEVKMHMKYTHDNVPWPKKKKKDDVTNNKSLNSV